MSDIPQKNSFKTIQLIYGALILSVFVFTVIAYVISNKTIFAIDVSNAFTLIVPIVAASGVFLSNFLYGTVLNKIDSKTSLSSKLAKYQTATVIRAACLEGPAFLAIAATFMSENVSFLLISLLMLIVMYLRFPTKERFSNDVTLNFKEKSALDKL